MLWVIKDSGQLLRDLGTTVGGVSTAEDASESNDSLGRSVAKAEGNIIGSAAF